MQQVLAQGYTTVSLTFVYPPPTGYALEKKVVKSKVGEKVGLPCCHEIPSSESLRNYRVYWQKNTTEVVLAYAEGKMFSKHKQYGNRTEMDARNLTLWISPVEILDNGSYQCVVQHLRVSQNSVVVCDESVTLFVTGRWIASQYLRLSGASLWWVKDAPPSFSHNVGDRLSQEI